MNPPAASKSGPIASGYLGLAPFLRASIAGQDLRQLASQLLRCLDTEARNPLAWMNLSIAMQCLAQEQVGLALQQEALRHQRSFCLAARRQPASRRLLILVTAGSIQSYTPLDCLLEVSDIDLVFHYVFHRPGMLDGLPAHDAIFVGIADPDKNQALLDALDLALRDYPRPVLNAPARLKFTTRDAASALLAGIEKLLVPATKRVPRAELQALAESGAALDHAIIVRPLDSQGGRDLAKIRTPAALAAYLGRVRAAQFFTSPFVDYRNAQGWYQKIRLVLVNGQPYVCHMAVSRHWMVHYVNAGMYQSRSKREQEARFMRTFAAFAKRHQQAFQAIHARMQLEYLVMDCAETSAGELLLFEIDTGGVVHAMDARHLFPYKNRHIGKIQNALRQLLPAARAPDCQAAGGTP